MDALTDIQKQSKSLDFEALREFKSKSQEKTNAWLESRRGRFTASEYGRLMGYEDKDVFPKGAETYVLEKVLEVLTIREEDTYKNPSMDWGNLNEKEAAEKFMDVTGLEVHNYGDDQEFIPLGKHLGCTPDGLIGSDGGIETKCPNSKTHFQYLKIKSQMHFKQMCTNYYWQIQGSMYITGRKYWYFVSYDPRFIDESKRIKILKIVRNDIDIENLKGRLTEAIKRRNSQLKEAS